MPGDRVLLLEDDANLGLVLQEHLQMQGYGVTLRVNGEEGLEAFRAGTFDICLVDVMMPRKDGFTFAREIRKTDRETPLIFLTAKSLKEDKIQGFTIGCDDYITKPFSIEELLLRIQAVLKRSRRVSPFENAPTEFTIGDYRFDAARQILSFSGRDQRLTPKETELLRLLCIHRNQTLPRDLALREIWGDENYFSGRSMDVFVSKLRKYLRDDPRVEIMGIHGKGFRLMINA
jgi:DNA-binding response OmpR family regulator